MRTLTVKKHLLFLCSTSKIDAGLPTSRNMHPAESSSSSLHFSIVSFCEGLKVLHGEDQLMGNHAFSLDLPSGLVCSMTGGGKVVCGLVAGAFWASLIPKACSGLHRQLSKSILNFTGCFLGEFGEDLQGVCICPHDSSFSCLSWQLDRSLPCLACSHCLTVRF